MRSFPCTVYAGYNSECGSLNALRWPARTKLSQYAIELRRERVVLGCRRRAAVEARACAADHHPLLRGVATGQCVLRIETMDNKGGIEPTTTVAIH